MNRGHWILLLVIALLGACSMRNAIDSLSSPEDRAFAQDFVAKIRSGDRKSLQPMFVPELWPQTEPQLDQARSLFPPTPGTTELIGYHVRSNSANGVTTSTKDYTLVTHDDSHWTTTLIRTQAMPDGAHRITAWDVTGSREMPALYRQFQAMEETVPRMRWIGGIILLAFAGLVFWLVRRSRRRRSAQAGNAP